MENTMLIGRNKGDKGNRNGSREIRVVTKESSLGGVGSHKLSQLVAISPVIQLAGGKHNRVEQFLPRFDGSSFRFPRGFRAGASLFSKLFPFEDEPVVRP